MYGRGEKRQLDCVQVKNKWFKKKKAVSDKQLKLIECG